MKKLLLLLVMVFAFNLSNAQGNYEVSKYVDDMSGKVSYLSDVLILANAEESMGFTVQPVFSESNELDILVIKNIGIGSSCVENSTCIILFDDGTKLNLEAWNDFNCDGTNYMSLNRKQREHLLTSPIDRWRFTNGRDYVKYTRKLLGKEKYYLQDILYSGVKVIK